MNKYYSKIKKDALLGIKFSQDELVTGRLDISPEEEYLQLACIKPDVDSYRPHIHKILKRDTYITQECWILFQGRVEVVLYDFDTEHTIIDKIILESGDAFITFRGGHGYNILDKDSIIWEMKSGPYLGQNLDKEFIDV